MKFIDHRLKTRYLASTDVALFQYAEFQTQFRIERSILTGLRGFSGMRAVDHQRVDSSSMLSNIGCQTWKIMCSIIHVWCFKIKKEHQTTYSIRLPGRGGINKLESRIAMAANEFGVINMYSLNKKRI